MTMFGNGAARRVLWSGAHTQPQYVLWNNIHTRAQCTLRSSTHIGRRCLHTAQSLAEGIQRGDRGCLARGITLVESTRADHRKQARELVSLCMQVERPRTLRIGLTGTPGVGKSTFIEALGMQLVERGHRVSVLAVDPSSARSGGSILGDKTRMQGLSCSDRAFVRPSPSRGTLGGVAQSTLDSIVLTEAGGYDVCLVETVGVGQSETMVAGMVDMFVLLVQPASGDELQGVKRGIMELADLLVVTKADALQVSAKLTKSHLTNSLRLLLPRRSFWSPKCIRASAVTNHNLDRVWSTILFYFEKLQESGEWDAMRAAQRQKWLWQQVSYLLLERLHCHHETQRFAQSLEKSVHDGSLPPSVAAEQIVDRFLLKS